MGIATRALVLLLAAPLLGAGCRHGSSDEDRPVDLAAIEAVPDLGFTGSCDHEQACPQGQRCHHGGCIADNGVCMTDDDCQNDTWCDCTGDEMATACMCVPWGVAPRGLFDPACQQSAPSSTELRAPKLKCHWDGDAVAMAPVVADLNRDGVPEIVFATTRPSGNPVRLVAIRTSNCSELFNQAAPIATGSQLAIADLDADGIPEIVAIAYGQFVQVYDNRGRLLATSNTPYSNQLVAYDCTAPAIANVDGEGPPEIIAGGQVLRYLRGKPSLQVLWTVPVAPTMLGTAVAVADIDGDGRAEVLTGAQVLDGITGEDKTPAQLASLNPIPSFPAVADVNGDGHPDLVLVESRGGQQRVLVYDFVAGEVIFGPFAVQGGGLGGPPSVADFDGDSVPDIGVASTDHYYVYALKCAGLVPPPECSGADRGVLWAKPTRDLSSGATGSTVFDFDGDGRNEVVYRDECWLRLFRGYDGKVLFAVNITSGTLLDQPVVADVDGDGHADIVVTSDLNGAYSCPAVPEADTRAPWIGGTRGVYIFRDPLNRWMPSRRIWNQHTYHITNINDDLTVPAQESPSWATPSDLAERADAGAPSAWNSYRQNVQSAPLQGGPRPDFTAAPAGGIDGGAAECKTKWTLRASICNRGTKAAPDDGVPGSFYLDDPRIGASLAPICTGVTSGSLAPGECEPVECTWSNPPETPIDLWFRANDPGFVRPVSDECKALNNVLFLPQARCGLIS